jgi:hypothetical protein
MENNRTKTLEYTIENMHFLDECFDPPPWKLIPENEQKTEGWIERQRWEQKQKEYEA